MLQQLLPAGVFAFLLVFTRVGAAVMLLPGFGEVYVSARVRLMLALLLALVLSPAVAALLPALPESPLALTVLLAGEIAVGILIGGAARLTLSALNVAGTVIAFQSGLSSAQFFDPTQGAQGVLVATFLTLVGITAIFASDLHLMLLRATADSYALFPAGRMPAAAGFAEVAGRFVAGSFTLGIQIAAPFLVYGLVFYIGLGLLARLMPQFQVFFVAMPLQIALGLALLAISLGAGMLWFAEYFERTTAEFLVR